MITMTHGQTNVKVTFLAFIHASRFQNNISSLIFRQFYNTVKPAYNGTAETDFFRLSQVPFYTCTGSLNLPVFRL